MRRLTTPTHIYELPFDTALIDKIRMVYTQDEKEILVKETTNCMCEGRTIKIELTQEETALFDCKKHFAEIQAHILSINGKSLVSKPLKVSVEKCLDSEVLL